MAGLFNDFNPASQNAPSAITRGSLIAFQYNSSYGRRSNTIHDPYPMVIITDIGPKFIRGVNLHYLTFPYIKNILSANCGNSSFNYQNIKSDKYVADSFRMYNRMGVKKIKNMDCAWLLDVLGAVRSFSPSELEKLKGEVHAQIKNRLQAKADEVSSYEDWRNNFMKGDVQTLDNRVSGVQDTMSPPNSGISPPSQIDPTENI